VSDENADLLKDILKQTYEKAEECVKTNYYGTKGVTEALLPLLQLSQSARIVNISSFYGQLKVIKNMQVFILYLHYRNK
jgi:(+)-neomenthol dehydrogenase